MKEKDFDELIKRFLAGQATREEADSVEKWLEQRSAQDPFARLTADERRNIRLRMLKALPGTPPEKVAEDERGDRKLRTIFIYRVAAAIMFLAVFSYAVVQFASPAANVVVELGGVASRAENKKIILSDGTIVWLRANSSIRYPGKFTGKVRDVSLTGEALFEVFKDPDRPFIIQCGNVRAKVLGTSFNIKSHRSDVEVFVLTGKVELSAQGNNKPLIVLPNEKAVYRSAENELGKVIASTNEKTATTDGTGYSMQFNATRMEEIIRRIEGKFDMKILVSDKRLNNWTLTADFTDQSLDRTLDMIAQSLQIEYTIKEREILLAGMGCDKP